MLGQCVFSPHQVLLNPVANCKGCGSLKCGNTGCFNTIKLTSCSNFPPSIKISFYATLYTWPFEQSVTINGVCILKPNLGKEQEIIHLAGEDGAVRASSAQLFMSIQRHRKMKCINRVARPSSEWGFKWYWCGANRCTVYLLRITA